jgi:hypothetical protein
MSLLAILACAIRFSGSGRADARLVARAWLLAGLASALMGWLQYTGMGSSLAPWVSHANFGEAFGNLRQRNLYASLTSIALCSLLWLARNDAWFHRPLRVILPAALLAAGNALSHSRTGLFELLLILGLAGIWGLHRERAARWALAPVVPAYPDCGGRPADAVYRRHPSRHLHQAERGGANVFKPHDLVVERARADRAKAVVRLGLGLGPAGLRPLHAPV